MHKQRIAVLICGLAGLAATFLPWIHLPQVGTIHGTAGEGRITFLLFLPAIHLAVTGDRPLPSSGRPLWGGLVPALMAGALGLYKIIEFKLHFAAGQQGSEFAEAMARAVRIGSGLWLVTSVGVVMTALALLLGRRQ